MQENPDFTGFTVAGDWFSTSECNHSRIFVGKAASVRIESPVHTIPDVKIR